MGMMAAEDLRPTTWGIPAGTAVDIIAPPPNDENVNVAVVAMFQIGKVALRGQPPRIKAERLRREALSLLLGTMIREPCFDSLRTVQQLGYVVTCGVFRKSYGISA